MPSLHQRRSSGQIRRSPRITGSTKTGLVLQTPLRPGQTALLGLTAIPPAQVPAGAKQAVKPNGTAGSISGTVWRDFSPGGGKPGVIEPGEQGIPGATVQLRDASTAKVVATVKSTDDGTFTFANVKDGSYRAAVGAETFSAPYEGVSWLGPKLITPAVMIAYIWVWAGFAMVITPPDSQPSHAKSSKQHAPTAEPNGKSFAGSPSQCSPPCCQSSSSR